MVKFLRTYLYRIGGKELKYNFDENFFWGVSTAAHQIEGNNFNSDWWKFEAEGKVKNGERSGNACNSYELFRKDVDLAKALNVNSFRFSTEWSRIEPRDGEFDRDALNHYAEEAAYMREKGIEPVVTLHHFTNPVWFTKMNGWESEKSVAFFLRYVDRVLEALKDVKYFITINEPNVYGLFGYMQGYWPPEVKDRKKMGRVFANMALAHSKAYDMIHSRRPDAMVSVAMNTGVFRPKTWSPLDWLMSKIVEKQYNFSFTDSVIKGKPVSPVGKVSLPGNGKMDFVGINYYTRFLVGFGAEPKITSGDLPKTEMDYEFYPEGIGRVVESFWKRYGLPVMVTENGIADGKDEMREEYILKTLEALSISVSKGVKLSGYFHWSLMDNFEWKEGFGPRFGLYRTDFKTFERTLRKSGKFYSKICANDVEDAIDEAFAVEKKKQ